MKSDTDTGYGYVLHKAHMQNDLRFLQACIVFAGKIWSTHKLTIMSTLSIS